MCWSAFKLTLARKSYGKLAPSGRFQAMRRVAAILDHVTLASLVDRLRRHAEVFGQNSSGLIARLDRRTNLGRHRRLAVEMDQHARSPSRMSLRTDLAMKRAERRGEM